MSPRFKRWAWLISLPAVWAVVSYPRSTRAMTQAGWYPADPITVASSVRIVAERDPIAGELEKADGNGGGDLWHTDGRLAVVVLGTTQAPASAH